MQYDVQKTPKTAYTDLSAQKRPGQKFHRARLISGCPGRPGGIFRDVDIDPITSDPLCDVSNCQVHNLILSHTISYTMVKQH